MSSPLDADVQIARRFRGPANSGNGGYTAGRLAGALLDARDRPGETDDPLAVTVTLRMPPPLDVRLRVRRGETPETAGLWHGDDLVAEASIGELAGDPVAPVDIAQAMSTASAYARVDPHPFPGCFVCGPDREVGDGMRLTPGKLGPGRTACVWTPDEASTGIEFSWSALDCPGGWTSHIETRPAVLGRMTAQILRLPTPGQAHVVVGALLGEQGRKTFTATSLYDEGRLVARAKQTWISVDPAAFQA